MIAFLKRRFKQKAKERRTFARFSVELPVRFRQAPNGQNQQNLGQAADVSANGLRFITKSKLRPNTVLEMWLGAVNRVEPVRVTGQVIWSKYNTGGERGWQSGIYINNVHLVELGRFLTLWQ